MQVELRKTKYFMHSLFQKSSRSQPVCTTINNFILRIAISLLKGMASISVESYLLKFLTCKQITNNLMFTNKNSLFIMRVIDEIIGKSSTDPSRHRTTSD